MSNTSVSWWLALAVACSDVGEVDPSGEGPWLAPENRWPSAQPPGEILGEGFEVGEIVPDLRLPDQHGQTVSLWQFYGRVVLLSIGTVWCPPCREIAVSAEALAAESGAIHVTVLLEDESGLAPSPSDAAAWAEVFCPDSPVLADPERETAAAIDGGYPEILLVGMDLEVIADPADFSEDSLEQLIKAEIASHR